MPEPPLHTGYGRELPRSLNDPLWLAFVALSDQRNAIRLEMIIDLDTLWIRMHPQLYSALLRRYDYASGDQRAIQPSFEPGKADRFLGFPVSLDPECVFPHFFQPSQPHDAPDSTPNIST